jgi:type II secretory pathway component GspD/PulD (secretin)
MRNLSLALALTPLLAFAQNALVQDKVFYLSHAENPQAIQEIVNIVRAMTAIRDVSMNPGTQTISVRGDNGQLDTIQWLITGLDKAPQPAPALTARDFRVPPDGAEAIKILYLAHSTTPQALQETVNAIRALSDVVRIFPDNAQHAIALRGNDSQVALSEWLAGELDQPNRQNTEFRLTDGSRNLARILYPTKIDSAQQLQEMVNTVRGIAEITRLMPYNPRAALVMRGTDDQLRMAEFVFHALDQPTDSSAAPEFVGPRADDIVRVYYLSQTATPTQLQQMVNAIRTTTNLTRLMPYPARKAVAMRGTTQQLTQAAQLIQTQQP